MDLKKRKTVTQIWRQVSTHSSSYPDDSEKREIVAEEEEEEMGLSVSSHVPTAERIDGQAEAMNEQAAMQGSDGSIHVDSESVLDAEKHSISMEVGASLMRYIRGKEGVTQTEIEEEMGVKIIFPTSKKEDSIIIEGSSTECVTRASAKIQIIVDKAVESPNLDYSHFISLPLAIHVELVNKLNNFQNSILGDAEFNHDENMNSDSDRDNSNDEAKDQKANEKHQSTAEVKAEDFDECKKTNMTNIPLVSYQPKELTASDQKTRKLAALGIEKSIFIKPKTFHLTVLMLKLWNKSRVQAAAEVLQGVSEKVINALDCRPISIKLKGLQCMRGSSDKARVVYIPVEEIGGEDRLMRACQVIINAFVEAGLVLERDAQQNLKLHATVMNARHRKRRNKKNRRGDSFNARGIFEQYGSEDWGEFPITEAHLSQRFLFDKNGYYHCCASIPFPGNMQVD